MWGNVTVVKDDSGTCYRVVKELNDGSPLLQCERFGSYVFARVIGLRLRHKVRIRMFDSKDVSPGRHERITNASELVETVTWYGWALLPKEARQ